jgi:hypothetical protein
MLLECPSQFASCSFLSDVSRGSVSCRILQQFKLSVSVRVSFKNVNSQHVSVFALDFPSFSIGIAHVI